MRTDGRDKEHRGNARNEPRKERILDKLLGRVPTMGKIQLLNLPPKDHGGSPNSRLNKEPPEPPRIAFHDDENYDGDQMIEAFHSDPFPRTAPATIFIDTEGKLLATVAHDMIHYIPDSIAKEKHDQFEAGPGAGGPGLYELALCVMVHFLPAGFDGSEERVMLRTPRPKSEPVGISRPAWDLHVEFAEEALVEIRPEHTDLEAAWMYDWISERRPDLQDIVYADPTPDPFEGLF